ncbi:MAG TPA: plastocyanin/azurin family copper-binding protein [Gaiellaceae bacterium]|nr:plastocyanin/azurin family copper-binding protein [Gaiellaceae bacterium]
MTKRLFITMLVLVAAVALAAAACGGDDDNSAGGATTTTEETTTEQMTTEETTTGGAASMELEGETGPGFEIEVKQNGADAESVAAGTYTLKVEDKSSSHNFHLIGPGVDEEVTTVPFTGDKEVTVTLKPGTYTYQCDPHADSGMKGTFEVT